MKNALCIGLFLIALFATPIAKGESLTFLSVLDDVPLMAGLSETTDGAVYFDTPAGRIVEAYALGTVTKESVLSYYKESLPSLGWKRTAHGSYEREGEFLTVSVKMENQIAVVRFALSPDGK